MMRQNMLHRLWVEGRELPAEHEELLPEVVLLLNGLDIGQLDKQVLVLAQDSGRQRCTHDAVLKRSPLAADGLGRCLVKRFRDGWRHHATLKVL